MPPERRLEAAELFWADEESTEQQIEAVGAIAAHMKFRTKSVLSLSRTNGDRGTSRRCPRSPTSSPHARSSTTTCPIGGR